uniref:Uncharacterized protein n=1 Tax=Mycena chlorophos TaxID=658473 RepID=A0ABQ0L3Y6_MYCCL|nr:predicted protein [Mycena chlorophos]
MPSLPTYPVLRLVGMLKWLQVVLESQAVQRTYLESRASYQKAEIQSLISRNSALEANLQKVRERVELLKAQIAQIKMTRALAK